MKAETPITPEEVREAREFIARWIDADASKYPPPVGSYYKLLARYARELERHAEAMADALNTCDGNCCDDNLSKTAGDALTAYRAFTTTEPTP